MPDKQNSSIKIILVALGVVMILVVLVAVIIFTKGVGIDTMPFVNTEDEKPITYTQEELQEALDKPMEFTESIAESTDQEGNLSQVKIDPVVEQKRLREALTVLAPKEEVANHSQDELEKALRQ